MVQYIPYSCIEKFNIVKMSILSKLTYNVIPIKTATILLCFFFFLELDKLFQKSVCPGKGTTIAKTILKKNNLNDLYNLISILIIR